MGIELRKKAMPRWTQATLLGFHDINKTGQEMVFRFYGTEKLLVFIFVCKNVRLKPKYDFPAMTELSSGKGSEMVNF